MEESSTYFIDAGTTSVMIIELARMVAFRVLEN